jgi:RNA polymerase sigma-70 factor (ECF subfamily)
METWSSSLGPRTEGTGKPDVVGDLALARRLLAGDESAFEEFFAAYFPRLYRFACSRLRGNEDAAEEVVQSVLIRALRKIDTYRGEAALFTWLCTMCRRDIAAWYDRAGRSPEVSWFDSQLETRAALDVLAAGDDPDAAWSRIELSRLVHMTLDHLPRRYADALEWKYIEGLPVDEIAFRLDVGYKAAESILTRARQAFREGFAAVLTEAPRRGRPWDTRPSEG